MALPTLEGQGSRRRAGWSETIAIGGSAPVPDAAKVLFPGIKWIVFI